MLEIGKRNILKIERESEFGIFLNDGAGNDILMPKRYVLPEHQPGAMVDVFIYYDSEDRIVAVTDQPKVEVGQFAYLPVVAISKYGVFLDWGLPKDLFAPWREQQIKMQEDTSYVVHVYVDTDSNRIAASSRLDLFLDNVSSCYTVGQEVEILVYCETDLGYKVIINNLHDGLMFGNEVFTRISIGFRSKAFIKKIREDGKIDVSLYKQGYKKVGDATTVILDALQKAPFIAVTDKSDSEQIARIFGISKKSFKQAIGALYKQKLISLESNGIKLINQNSENKSVEDKKEITGIKKEIIKKA